MNSTIKRRREDSNSSSPSLSTATNTSKKNKVTVFSTKHKAAAALVDLIQLVDDNGGGGVRGLGCNSVSAVLEPGRVYTVGRSNRDAKFIFNDPRVSKQHCQLLFDGFLKKLYLLNGALLIPSSIKCSHSNDHSCNDYDSCIVNEFRSRLIVKDTIVEEKGKNISCSSCRYVFKGALNGVFLNGVRVGEGLAVELGVGDEVLLVCGDRGGVCSGSKLRIGFVVRRVVFHEELVEPCFDGLAIERPRLVRPLFGGKVNKRIFALRVSDAESLSFECDEIVGKAKSLSARCKLIGRSHDPVSYIRQCMSNYSNIGGSYFCENREKKAVSFGLNGILKPKRKPQLEVCRKRSNETLVLKDTGDLRAAMADSTNVPFSFEAVVPLDPKNDNLYSQGGDGAAFGSTYDHKATNCLEPNYLDVRNEPLHEEVGLKECPKKITPPGKSFYLNRLDSIHQCSSGQENAVSLPELLHPVDSISKFFVATFTSDIGWFLSYCGIPCHLPVTIACHNTERCWSSDPGQRTCVPDPDFPNLVVVYPPFPEVIAFGKDRKNKGIGCHHPKLLVVQRENCMRVIITSANLVAKQWKNVTNTVWWQDFPCRSFPDCSSLFNQFNEDALKNYSTTDFAAQLAGFMASLVTDVPSQAYWIVELTKYDFTEANVHLIASVPGIHSYRSTSTSILAYNSKCRGRFLGSVEASVVGLSHRFRGAADSNGIQLKKLAGYLGQCSGKGSGMSEIILRRETNVPQDANAVSVLVSNANTDIDGDFVQLGFLPRTVAKWVSPLWDAGLFTFHGYVYPREALAAAFGESNIKVQLILHVSQGPNARDLTEMMKSELVVAFCTLIASLQRCTGLWRLEEVLHQYKWPESLETDFIYGASSIGASVGAQFLAEFSAAAGKRSQQAYDSQESDPEWGCWNAGHEMKCPSIRIIFPTIERVRSSHCGIFPSKHILAFTEKTWQKLKTVDILHDAIPHPNGRDGHPMHVKVARRRFKSKKEASSYGWVYCGSHNMSAAAWGQHVSSKSGGVVNGPDKGSSTSLKLRVCNYELGCIFVFPPPTKDSCLDNPPNLDDISLPFVVPAPKYGPSDRPATKRAMSEAVAELVALEGRIAADLAATEEMVEEDLDDEDEVETGNYVEQEAQDEKAYADVLWHHVDSSQSF